MPDLKDAYYSKIHKINQNILNVYKQEQFKQFQKKTQLRESFDKTHIPKQEQNYCLQDYHNLKKTDSDNLYQKRESSLSIYDRQAHGPELAFESPEKAGKDNHEVKCH